MSRIQDGDIEELVITDSIPLPPEKHISKITVLSLAPLVGEAIIRIHTGRSVGELFHFEEKDEALASVAAGESGSAG